MHNVIDVYSQATVEGHEEGRIEGELGLLSPRSWTAAEGQETCWPDYCDVQREVARRVVENYVEGDLIWIHVCPSSSSLMHDPTPTQTTLTPLTTL